MTGSNYTGVISVRAGVIETNGSGGRVFVPQYQENYSFIFEPQYSYFRVTESVDHDADGIVDSSQYDRSYYDGDGNRILHMNDKDDDGDFSIDDRRIHQYNYDDNGHVLREIERVDNPVDGTIDERIG